MFEKLFKSLVVAVGMVLIGFMAVAQQIGSPAPDFTLKDLNGNDVSLKDFRGQPVFVSFWFTGCPICAKELANVQEFHKGFGDLIKVLAINVRDNKQTIEEFLKKNKLEPTYTILLDPQGETFLKYRVLGMPGLFFIDTQGAIQAITFGSSLTKEELARVFAEKIFNARLLPLPKNATVTASVDKNKNGHAEAQLLDFDGNGKPDGGQIDSNDDGTFEASLGVLKGNVRGTIPEEAKLEIQQIKQFFFFTVAVRITIDLNSDGQPEITLEDTNLDGTADKILLDPDSDGKPDLKFP